MVVLKYRCLGSTKTSWVLFCAFVNLIILMILLNLLDISYFHGVGKQMKRNFYGYLDFTSWVKDIKPFCDGHFKGFGHEFAVLKKVILKPGDQKFYLPCDNIVTLHHYTFDFGKEGTHLNTWLNNVVPYSKKQMSHSPSNIHKKLTILVQRYEYANLYHTMTDWYNVFLVTKLLNISIRNVNVMLYDSHAPGHLDKPWNTLFGGVLFFSNLTTPTMFRNLVWNIIGYESPVNHFGLKSLPFVEDFHNFFIQRHGIARTKRLNCDNVSVLFLWRRDYVAHPNNPSGLISRKIKNEDELIDFIHKKYPSARVGGAQLDVMSFHQQLEVITTTDILISMHGAGLAHVLFLPSHAGVVEMFPTYWPKFGMNHFKSMARWRGIKHTSWQNLNPSVEDENFYSYVSPEILFLHVDQLYTQICPT